MLKVGFTNILFAISMLALGCPDGEDDDTGDDDTSVDDDDVSSDDDDVSSDDDDVSDDDSAGDDDDSAGDDDDTTQADTECDVAVDALWVPADHAAIQDAIAAAADGDLVCVSAGTYFENLDFLGKAIHVLGADGPEVTTVDGSGAGAVANFDAGEGLDSVLEGLTLTNGQAEQGGGVQVHSASPTLRNLVVTGNLAAESGGGFYLYTSEASLSDVTVSDNEVQDYGGGLRLEDSSPTLDGVVITGNRAGYGGGLYADGGELTLTDSILSYNTASEGYSALRVRDSVLIMDHVEITGNSTPERYTVDLDDTSATGHEVSITHNTAWEYAGLYVTGPAVVSEFTDLVVSDNEATSDSGGIYLDISALTVTRGTIERNLAGQDGGGIVAEAFYNNSSVLTLVDTVVRDNEAGRYGGGFYTDGWGSGLTVANVVFSGNSAGEDGGGLYLGDSTSVAATHLVVAGNTAGNQGGGVWAEAPWGVDIDGAVFAANSAGAEGGGLFVLNHPIQLVNAVVMHNEAAVEGGGIHVTNTVPTFSNVVLAANTSGGAGGGLSVSMASLTPTYCVAWDNSPADYHDVSDPSWDPTGADGNLSVDPQLLDTSAPDPLDWDLHLGAASLLIDAGDPAILDPDGSRSDIGAYGGSSAATWDLDQDGYPLWWLPGPYDPATSPGMDCDDGDGSVYPGNGC